MRILLLSSAAVALMGAGTALAADSASVQITATQAQSCTINDGGTSSALALGAVDAPIAGTFSYQCNFVGSPTLTFTSLNGGVTDGVNEYDYGIYLNDVAPASPPSAWLQSSAAESPGAVYPNITTTISPNTAVTPFFSVGLSEAILIAGSYSDTLTIAIAP